MPSRAFFAQLADRQFISSGKQPDLMGIAIGAIADPALPPPAWSLWEQSKHHWIEMPGNIRHFDQGD